MMISVDQESVSVHGPGLYYVHRDGLTVSYLSGSYFPEFDRPEQDVAAALMRYALDRVTEPRTELTRGDVS